MADFLLEKVCTPGFRDISDGKVTYARHAHFTSTLFVMQLIVLLVPCPDKISYVISYTHSFCLGFSYMEIDLFAEKYCIAPLKKP